jgi:hypothetical protein
MVDVFLMGTAGKFDDPKRPMWREPIKEACRKLGISFFDPVVPVWDEDAHQREVDALAGAKVIVMGITAHTASIASLAESGWAALSAVYRKQAFGLYVDTMYLGEGFDASMSQASIDLMQYLLRSKETQSDEITDASRRARKLVEGHAQELAKQFPELNMYIAPSPRALRDWTVETVQKLKAEGLLGNS